MKWMVHPITSFKMIVITVIAYFNWRKFTPGAFNPFEPLLLLSNPVPRHPEDPEGTVRYAKSYKDILFVLFYVVVFSFTRQFITIYLLRPLAYKLGVRKEAKVLRFLEQAYTFIYFSFSGAIGYPHWDMKPHIKLYYLLQTSYWLQQMLVLILGLEKPRKDFNELIMHHIVTLWLVLWSYLINLSMIGNAIFVTMDVSDIFLALAKCFNYVRPGHWVGNFIFGFFILVWSYMRHWLNLRILWSVWYEFDLIPSEARRWWTPDGVWMLLNLFWYFLIWRILIRALLYNHLADERSDDEEEEEENDKNK
ncbi:longevity assurance proteins LAG1/LAC1 [Wallemia mellicola]|nr:longevity assurance proteins LAG1/LAC1 [Wallemia mellicola]TIC30055.1 longevity assurance proteins LAG1/LAC1 [Wallemia mellicola]